MMRRVRIAIDCGGAVRVMSPKVARVQPLDVERALAAPLPED